MGRAWGTNLYPGNPVKLTLASDTACAAGVKTVVLDSGASPLIKAGAGGGWYLIVDVALAITFGASGPSALTITLDLVTAGANQDSYALPVNDLIALAQTLFTVSLMVPNSGSIWYPTGDEVQITVNPTGQAVTVNAICTRGLLTLPQGT
jgi:hypothetical protein